MSTVQTPASQIAKLSHLLAIAISLPLGKTRKRVGTKRVQWGQNDYIVVKRDCGTSACLMGFAGLSPWFRKQGLAWDERRQELTLNGFNAGIHDAGQSFFGLGEGDTTQLFFGDAGPQRKTKAAIVRTLKKLIKECSLSGTLSRS